MSIPTYTHVPTSPWALPTLRSHPRIMLTPTRLARLVSLYNSPPSSMLSLKLTWPGGGTGTSAGAIMGNMINYLATGNLTNLTSAYNAAITGAGGGTAITFWAQTAPFVFDWGYNDLTPTQKTNLIALIDSQTTTFLNAGSNGPLAGCGQEQGYGGFAMGVLAIEGEVGATSRLTTLRNVVQNLSEWIDESMGSGHWIGYQFEAVFWLMHSMFAYHIAGGQENLIPSRSQFATNRSTYLAYKSANNGYTSMCGPSDHDAMGVTTNSLSNIDGAPFRAKPEFAWHNAVYADVLGSGLAQLAVNNCLAASPSLKWTDGQDTMAGSATWMAFMFYNSAIPTVSPSTLPNSAIFPLPGLAVFRSGWTQVNDVKGTLYSGIFNNVCHDSRYAGNLEITRGDDQLICTEYSYSGQPCNWLTGSQNGTEVGMYSMCKSTVLFSANADAKPDRSGSQTLVMPPGSTAAFPVGAVLGGGGSTWLNGTVSGFVYNGGSPGAKTQVTADYTNAWYPNNRVSSIQRIVAYVNGAANSTGTFFVQDNFTTVGGTIDRIRALFGMRAKPVGMTGETIVTGNTNAGVMTYANQPVVVRWRNSQATIQMVSPTPVLLRLVGGGNGVVGVGEVGFESYFDGANLDYYNNAQSGKNVQQYKRIQGCFRLECETTPAAAGSQMLFAITVGDIGTTAPTYTQAQVLAIMSGAGGPQTMPGMTYVAQRATLDTEFGTTRYLALYTTAPNDDGTGGVEVSGTGYARKTILSTDWAAAIGGGPATKANSVAQAFPQAGASWGSIVAWGSMDAPTGGSLRWTDFMGLFNWAPFTATATNPCAIRSAAHGLTTGNTIAVTQKYGGTLPTTADSWAGLITVTVIDVDNFTVPINATGSGDGQFRRVVPVSITSPQVFSFDIGNLKVSQG